VTAPMCDICGRIEASEGSTICFRCQRRADEGKPPINEVEREQARAQNRKFVFLKGYHNGPAS
jgi:tRNA(Ile2) C34 agmatinyltransferase TiaS